MTRRLARIRLVLLLAVAALVAAFGVLAYGLDLFRRLELDSVDARFSIRGDQKAPADMVIVEVDDTTFSELGLQWPFPRSAHAEVIRRLNRAGARVIAYDVQISERTNLSGLVDSGRNRPLLRDLGDAEDLALLEAEDAAHGKVVLSTTEVSRSGEPKVLGGTEGLKLTGARAGSTNIPPDPEGVLRRFPYEIDGLKAFAVVTTEVATGHPVNRDSVDEDGAWIDFRGPPGTFRSVPFSRVVRGRTPPDLFRDKIVIVGASAPSLQDLHPTATGEGMAGAEIQANAISTILRGFPLDSPPGLLTIALLLLAAVGPPLATLRWRPRPVFVATLGIAAGYAVATQLAFNGGTILPVVYPLGCLALSSIGTLGVHYGTAAFERQRVREMFARFVPEQVVDDVLDCAESDLRLSGVRRLGTVMFSDLRNFTSFAESLPPERVIEVLNRYLSEMSDAIMDEGGTLVAYMGDGIMCVFGAPLEQEDHADRALAAARQMMRRLERFNSWLRFEALSEGFEIGIGINSGYVMSGNVGSDRRLEYTAVGDTTNTAARMEGMTKGTPHHVLISESTRCMLTRDAPDLRYVDSVPVRGRKGTVKLWTLIEPGGTEPAEGLHPGARSEDEPGSPRAKAPST